MVCLIAVFEGWPKYGASWAPEPRQLPGIRKAVRSQTTCRIDRGDVSHRFSAEGLQGHVAIRAELGRDRDGLSRCADGIQDSCQQRRWASNASAHSGAKDGSPKGPGHGQSGHGCIDPLAISGSESIGRHQSLGNATPMAGSAVNADADDAGQVGICQGLNRLRLRWVSTITGQGSASV